MRSKISAIFVACLLFGLGCQRQQSPVGGGARPVAEPSSNGQAGVGHDSPAATQPAMGQSGPQPGDSGPPEIPSDPLSQLNAGFREMYQRVRKEQITAARPIVMVLGDQLTLLEKGGGQKEAFDRSPQYHALKAIAHVPLAIDICLVDSPPGPLDEQRRQELTRFCELVEKTREELSEYGFSETQLDRQQAIFTASLEYARQVQSSGQYLPDERVEFCRKLRPWLMTNAAEAARFRIDAYHTTMSDWRKTMTSDQWQHLKILILGAALPRKDNLAVQYFAKLLGEPGESRRIIYAESIFTPEPALDLLGTYVLDRQISLDFFDDPQRMNRDLLSDAAYEYLNSRDWTLPSESK